MKDVLLTVTWNWGFARIVSINERFQWSVY